MSILVCGANGQVGRELCELLVLRGIPHIATGRDLLDISDSYSVKTVFDQQAVTAVVNCAAYTAVDKAEDEVEQARSINLKGAINLASACAVDGIPLIHLSTDYVFAGDLDRPYLEVDTTNPQSIYGLSKLEGEHAIASILPQHIILRTSWVFGKYGNNFVKTMLRLAESRDHLAIVADQHGAPTSASGIASTCVAILERLTDDYWGIYHYTGAPYTTWFGFAEAIFDEAASMGLPVNQPTLTPISTADFPTAATRPANSQLNCDKIRDQFLVKPDNWRDQLRTVLNFVNNSG